MKKLIIMLLLAIILVSCSAPVDSKYDISQSSAARVVQIYADDTIKILQVYTLSRFCIIAVAQSTGISSMACF